MVKGIVATLNKDLRMSYRIEEGNDTIGNTSEYLLLYIYLYTVR